VAEPFLDLGDIGLMESALVAAVARNDCKHNPFTSALTQAS